MISTTSTPKALGTAWMLTRLMRRLCSLTNDISSMVVFSCCRRGQIPMSLATCTASKRTSTGYPPSRRCGTRSITVGLKPYRLSQYASVGPAILAPEMRRVLLVIVIFMVELLSYGLIRALRTNLQSLYDRSCSRFCTTYDGKVPSCTLTRSFIQTRTCIVEEGPVNRYGMS